MGNLRICIIGNLLGRNRGYITTQGQILTDLFVKEGYSVVSASSKINRFLRLIDTTTTIIKNRKRIDILILEVYSGLYFLSATVAAALGRLFDLPMIFVLRGGDLPAFSNRYPRWTRWVLEKAAILVAPSPFLLKSLAHFGLPIRELRNTVDFGKYPFKIRLAVEPKLIWMRSFHPLYNPSMAVNAISLVREKYPMTTLAMAGADKGLEPEIRRLVRDMGLENSVNFPGFLDHHGKMREFANADIYLNTNHIDNMPVSVVEACAMGLPVVATCVGGIPDMIRDGEDGLLVTDNDVQGMADAICSLIENPELAERLSLNGRTLAEKSAWKTVCAEWESLFVELIQTRKCGVRMPERGQVSIS